MLNTDFCDSGGCAAACRATTYALAGWWRFTMLRYAAVGMVINITSSASRWMPRTVVAGLSESRHGSLAATLGLKMIVSQYFASVPLWNSTTCRPWPRDDDRWMGKNCRSRHWFRWSTAADGLAGKDGQHHYWQVRWCKRHYSLEYNDLNIDDFEDCHFYQACRYRRCEWSNHPLQFYFTKISSHHGPILRLLAKIYPHICSPQLARYDAESELLSAGLWARIKFATKI